MTRFKTFIECNKTINIIETIVYQVLIEVLEYTSATDSNLKLITQYRGYYFDDVVELYRQDKLEV